MIIINSLNESRFTFNGVQYFKNYVTKVAGDKLTIYNAYNNKDILVPLTLFDQFRVNGSVYDTIEELQIAIIGVCYTRTTLDEGSPNSQNNIGRYLSFGEIAGGNDYITPTDVATFINNLNYSIVITAIDAPVTFDFTRNGVRYLFDFTPGKGMWGSANGANFGGTVQSFHFKLKSIFNITPTDIEDNQGATIISLGDVPTGDYLTKANSVQRDFNDAGELDENGSVISYYFSYTTDTVLYFIQFVGAAGVYNGTLVADDLVSTTNSNVVANINLQSVLENGSAATVNTEISIISEHSETDLYPGVSSISLEGGSMGFFAESIGISSTEGLSIGNNSNNLSFNNDSFQLVGGAGGVIQSNNTTGITINGIAGGVNIGGNTLGVNISGDGGGINLLGGNDGVTINAGNGGINLFGGNDGTIITGNGLTVSNGVLKSSTSYLDILQGLNFPEELSPSYISLGTSQTDTGIGLYSTGRLSLNSDIGISFNTSEPLTFSTGIHCGGTASFSNTPTTNIGAPTLDTHLTNKKYVDDSLPSGVGFGYWDGSEVTWINGNSQQMLLGDGTISDIDTKMRSQWIGINTGSNTPVTSSTNFQEAIWSLQAQVENVIPLSGTEVSAPLTGSIKVSESIGMYHDNGTYSSSFILEDGGVAFNGISTDGYVSDFILDQDGVFRVSSNNPTSQGITGSQDYTPNITDLDYVQKKYVDDVAIQDLQNVTDTGATTTSAITTGGLSIPAGTLNITDGDSSHYIKGDGTVLSFSYAVKTNLVGSHTVADGSTDQITELSQVRNAFYQLQNQININADNAIPLTGTEVGSPITGDIELSDTNKIELNGSIVNSYIQFSDEDGWLQFNTTDITSGAFSGFTVEGGSTQIVVNDGVGITKSFNIDYERGIRSNSDFTPNITDLDYVQKKYADTKESKGKLTQGISGSSTIDFVSYKQFGTRTTPITVDVTLNTTDATEGIIQVMYHNATSFTPPAGTTIIGNTPYVPNVLNMICMRYTSDTVEIWYTQDQ